MSKLSNNIKLTNIALGLLLSVIGNNDSIAADTSAKEVSVVNPEAVESLAKEAFIEIAKKVSEDRMSFQAAVLLFPILKTEPGLIDDPKAQERVGNAIRALKGPSDKEKYSKEERQKIIDRIIEKKTKDGKLQSISAVDMTKMIAEEGATLKDEKSKKEKELKAKEEDAKKQAKDQEYKKVGSVRIPSSFERELLEKLGVKYDPTQDRTKFVELINSAIEAHKKAQEEAIETLKKEQKLKIEELMSQSQKILDGASQGLNDIKKIQKDLADFQEALAG